MNDLPLLFLTAVLVGTGVVLLCVALTRLLRTEATPRLPAAGEIWLLKSPDNPFHRDREPISGARILEVRDGWVRYAIIIPGTVSLSSLFTDEAMVLSSFLHCYRPPA